jgi:3-hydroxymyristoyl/3-hydroxydecanoyl-(acyl carrier protein) dehydratase
LIKFINRITSYDSGSLKSQWDLSGDEDFFRDHFQGMPILPGMMILESLITAATWLGRKDSDFESLNFRLSELTNYKLPSSVRPPEIVNVIVNLIGKNGDSIEFRGKADVAGRTVGHGAFKLLREKASDETTQDFYSDQCRTEFQYLIQGSITKE